MSPQELGRIYGRRTIEELIHNRPDDIEETAKLVAGLALRIIALRQPDYGTEERFQVVKAAKEAAEETLTELFERS